MDACVHAYIHTYNTNEATTNKQTNNKQEITYNTYIYIYISYTCVYTCVYVYVNVCICFVFLSWTMTDVYPSGGPLSGAGHPWGEGHPHCRRITRLPPSPPKRATTSSPGAPWGSPGLSEFSLVCIDVASLSWGAG